METRSRKRAEASSAAPSSPSSGPTTRSSKRARLSSSSSASAAATATASLSSVNTRSRGSRTKEQPLPPKNPPPMDSANESSGSRRDRRSKDNSDKGKEKEHDVRIRDRDADRGLSLNMDGGAEDDDNDSEGGVGILHQNLTSASSALQGLLRKLGAGLDDLLPSSAMGSASSSHQNGRLKKILFGLRADGEEGRQVEALTQLCEMLSIGTEESLSTFSVDSFVPVLVSLLNHENNPDIMLLAARALTHLCDVLPSSCAAVVHYGAVSIFCARLLTIEYMDLAEQSLQALKKISQEHPTACLRAGALMAVLSYLDFFSTGVQRVALSTAANMCKKLPSDASDFVMEAVPLLTNLLHYHDAKVLEHASVCLTRIAEAFASSPEKLDELCNHGLVTQAASLISNSSSGGGQASLSTPTYTGLIRLLSTCASGSPLGAKTLLLLGISGILKDILSGSGVSSNASVSPALSRPPEQIFEIVNLANELLPPLPQGTISLPIISNMFLKGPIVRKSPAGSSGKQEDSNGTVPEISAREKLLNDQPELLRQFAMDLLPVLIQIYGSSVNGPVRHKCLSVIGKLMYFSTAEMIQSLLSVTNISSFLAGVLAWKDPHVLVPALKIAEILMEKLPGTFSKMFIREGVVHAVDQLILPGNSTNISTQAPSAEKDNDSISGASSRSRRYRRRSGSSNPDGNPLDDLKAPVSVNVGSPPSSVEIPTVNSSIRLSVSTAAKAFKDKYFPSDPGASEVGITDDLLNLKNLCMKLNAGADEQGTNGKGKSKSSGFVLEEYLIGVIADMLKELGKGDGVSTFEFIGSGVVAALLNYFSCGYFSKDKSLETHLPNLRQQALTRFKLFIAVALPSSTEVGTVTPMTVLVQKLQNALSSLERFPVVLSHSSRSSSGSARLSSGLSALSHPFKLRLCRAQGEKSLRDYSSNVVLVDPLASLAAIEEFLWSRIQRSESGQKSTVPAGHSESGTTPAGGGVSSPSTTRRHSTRSRSSVNIGDTSRKEILQDKSTSSSKGKGKAVLKPAQAESRGPQTRNATRRRAALDKEAQAKPVNGDSTSEDEDLDISPVEIDEALVIEDDDISDDEDDDHEDVLRDDSLPLVCSPDKVHDVKLGDMAEESTVAPATSDGQANAASGSSSKAGTVRGSDSADFRSGYTSSSRGAMSFAAAAMAGLGSVNNRGIRGGRDRLGRPLFGSSNDPPKLIFTAGGKQLNRHLTIYQAIQRQLVHDEDDDERFAGSNDYVSSDGSRLWGDIYTITYQKSENQTDRATPGGSSSNASKSGKSASNSGSEAKLHQTSVLDSILQGELPCELEKSNPTYNILALLRVLEGLNQLASRLRAQVVTDNFAEGKILDLDELSVTVGARVPAEEFISSKLTPKLARQIQDALALCSGSLPSWCYQLSKACPFLFPFETRRQYFYSTAFGLSRALYRLQQQQGADGHGSTNEREIRVGRLQRQKVRVSRNRILDSAAKVMELYSSQKAVLEVEYFGEVGTGLGPTLEFYTLLSHDIQRVALRMWRSGFSEKYPMEIDGNERKMKSSEGSFAGDGELVHSPLGLFPRPWPANADASEGTQFSKVIEYFRLLGRVMAKALQDGRLLDLPLSAAFYKLVLGQELDLHDILFIDAELGKTLQELNALVSRKRYIESFGGCYTDTIGNLHFRGAPIEDLCLDFTLPGYPEYILKPGDEIVDINNLEEYISMVVEATVKAGVMRQMEAFRAGFNQVFEISSLQIFTPQELDYLLCGRRELWKTETLADHIKFDHGYTAKSPAIVNLLEIMGEFTPEQQRGFCQFVTGAPRLPPGGLAVLNPKLTIVRKLSSSAANASSNGNGPSESVLPSANLSGSLPRELGGFPMLQSLYLNINSLQGTIPLELGYSSSLSDIDLGDNMLSGVLPPSIWNLCDRLVSLGLRGNSLSGSVSEPALPNSSCKNLQLLDLGGNKFSGSFPEFITKFGGLKQLDLGNNLFMGTIPQSLAGLRLEKLNLSHNNFSGVLPVFGESKFGVDAFEGNSPGLCGPPLASCARTSTLSSGAVAGIVISLMTGAVVLASLLIGYMQNRKRKGSGESEDELNEEEEDEENGGNAICGAGEGKLMLFPGGENLTLEDVLNATGQVLEKTCYGTAYKAKLADGGTIALRLLREGSCKDRASCLSVIKQLGKIRHENLIPLRAFYQGKRGEKLLIYDYLPLRTLHDLLHEPKAGKPVLNWARRHKIALGIARGLAYLHTGLEVPITHANVRSKNVLVDDFFAARLTDFGLDKLMIPSIADEMVAQAKTDGYKAPELQRMKKCNSRTDVYAFGILLLEILIGKKPGKNGRSGEYVDLPSMVKVAVLEETTMEVFDVELLKGIRSPMEDGLVQALKLAMGCCAPVASVRPSIEEVVRQLEENRPRNRSALYSPTETRSGSVTPF